LDVKSSCIIFVRKYKWVHSIKWMQDWMKVNLHLRTSPLFMFMLRYVMLLIHFVGVAKGPKPAHSWDFNYSQWWWWRFKPSGTRRHVTDASCEITLSMFRIIAVQNFPILYKKCHKYKRVWQHPCMHKTVAINIDTPAGIVQIHNFYTIMVPTNAHKYTKIRFYTNTEILHVSASHVAIIRGIKLKIQIH
jgi:hypothetical protein